MADRTMEELLRAPTEGYGEAIVLPEINADHFEIKTNLLQLVQANPFHGLENENPHAHINSFKMILLRLRFRNWQSPSMSCGPFTSEFTLEEIEKAYLYDKSISLESDHDGENCDPEEDIYVLEQLLNDDPFQLPPNGL
ncbi:hypothetical protein Tco_0268640 [Tanacetum coccineum]